MELTQEEKDAILRLGMAIRTMPKTLGITVYPEGLFIMKGGEMVKGLGELTTPIGNSIYPWQPAPEIPRLEEEP